MAGQVEVVTSFFAAWSAGPAAMFASFNDYFTKDAVWENVGLAVTRGPDEAVAYFGEALRIIRCDYMEVEILNIAAAGNVVMTERLDRFVRVGGEPIEPVRVMGVCEMRSCRIAAWRDYLDPRPFTDLAVHRPPHLYAS